MSAIELKFWDGQRQYEGHIREVSENYILAQIRIYDDTSRTIVPGNDVASLVIKHLEGRILPVEIGRGAYKADLLVKVEEIKRDPENPRRLNVMATFNNPGDRERAAIDRLLVETKKRMKPKPEPKTD